MVTVPLGPTGNGFKVPVVLSYSTAALATNPFALSGVLLHVPPEFADAPNDKIKHASSSYSGNV